MCIEKIKKRPTLFETRIAKENEYPLRMMAQKLLKLIPKVLKEPKFDFQWEEKGWIDKLLLWSWLDN